MTFAYFQRFKRAAILISPLFFLGVAKYFSSHIAILPPAKYELATIAPYLISMAGLFLALHFHRGRPFYALVILITAYWLIKTGCGNDGLAARSLFNILFLFVPFDLMLLTIMREKGVFTDVGRIRIMFLGGQGLLAYIMHNNYSLSSINNIFTSPSISNILSRSPIPQPFMLLIGLELSIILIFAIVRQSPVDSGFFGALISFAAACNWMHDPSLLIAFSCASVAIITVSILQDSYNMAFKDELTGIPSRRAMNEQLHGIGRHYAFAMVDIDHFKKFNDSYGHDVGDQVLKLVARKLATVTGGGKAFRYGGEEFAILFPRKNTSEVLAHLEEIREAIASYKLYIRDSDRPQGRIEGKKQRGNSNNGVCTHVTVSIGVSDSNDGELDKQEVIKAADKALYKAKNKGRNQVCK